MSGIFMKYNSGYFWYYKDEDELFWLDLTMSE